jgi:outer membrane receptor protein involved in Fe transport
MKRITTIIGILLFTTASLFAQEPVTFKGKVTSNKTPLAAVTVSLLKSTDSSLVKMAITDKDGHYEFVPVAPDNYLLMATSVGYTPAYLAASAGEQPEIQLLPTATDMSGVTVQAKRPLVETRIDKMVVNVDASPSNAGATALELLEKSPGISVDRDGNISLKGKQGVIVLMDGKQTYLSGPELANLLRSMPATQLDQVEIMTQPSAKYDAAGNAGIINLRTKKGRQMGFNGNVSVSYVQGKYPKSPNSLGFNYRKGKINIYTNWGYNFWQGNNTQAIQRKYPVGTGPYVFNQIGNNKNTSHNYNARVGIDYTINPKTTIGISAGGRLNKDRSYNNSFGNLYAEQTGVVDSSIAASNWERNTWKNGTLNFNYRKTLNSTGRELSADLDYIRYASLMNLYTDNRSLYPTMPEKVYLLRAGLPSDISIYSGKIDYVHPLSKETKLEAGVKSSLVKTDNNAPYEKYDDATGKWLDDVRKDHFAYNEQINAGYVNFSTQQKKWGIQAGLRGEHTHSKGTQVLLKRSVSRDYFQLFPTAFVSYVMSDKNSFGLNYGRRIERPNYQDMNPFQQFLDLYTYNQGNPYLTPQFTHNVELSHTFKSKLVTTLNYTYTTDIINDILKQNNETKVTYQTKENVATLRNLGLALSYNAPLTKWWTTSLYGNAYNNRYKGIVNGKMLQADVSTFSFNMNQQFRFAKTWGAEMSGFYQSRSLVTSMFLLDPMYVVSFGASKQIMKTKGSIKLSIIDPFRLQKVGVTALHEDIDVLVQNRWDNRRVGLTFTYRFSKGENVQQSRRNGSAQDEQNRIGK